MLDDDFGCTPIHDLMEAIMEIDSNINSSHVPALLRIAEEALKDAADYALDHPTNPYYLPEVDPVWNIKNIFEIQGLLVPISGTHDGLKGDFKIENEYILEVKLSYEDHWSKVRYISRDRLGEVFTVHTSSFMANATDPDCEYRIFKSMEVPTECLS